MFVQFQRTVFINQLNLSAELFLPFYTSTLQFTRVRVV